MNQPNTTTTQTQVDAVRVFLAAVALLAGAAASIFLVLIASTNAMVVQALTQMPQFIKEMHSLSQWYVPFIMLPSIVILFAVAGYSRTHFPELTNRIWAGLAAGAIATFVLDTFRQLGVIHGWLPMDTVMLFGKMISGPQASELTWTNVGIAYHFLNGAFFGMFFTIVFGKVNWLWAVAWALVVELGMMTLPPMAPIVGLFGNYTGSPSLFLITLVAHIGYGIALGLLAQHWVKDRGSILSIIRT